MRLWLMPASSVFDLDFRALAMTAAGKAAMLTGMHTFLAHDKNSDTASNFLSAHSLNGLLTILSWK